MGLNWVDWAIILAYVVFAMAVGVYFSRRASRGIDEYFVSGRNLPWWIAGTSMVATTFAADTPLAITGMVAKDGIAGNWLWWNMAASHMMAVFFFSHLWRRARIITDLELIELRYSGKSASVLRGFRSLWEGIFLNCIVMGWVMLAMTKIIGVLFQWPKWLALGISLLIALFYSVLSGFWGVVTTDFVQFFLAMIGSIVLAIIALIKVGGIGVVEARLGELYGADSGILDFVPQVGSGLLPMETFVAFIAVNWWANKAVDGGGYIAQRMFSTKNEKHSFLATLWYSIAHYALRPWPWILVALVSLVVFPHLKDPEMGYPKMVLEFLPVGLKGLMMASFLAAFMSTIDTQINWGSSYVINDFYKRFIKKEGSFRRQEEANRHYVRVSRLVVILLMILGTSMAYLMESIKGAWELFYAMTAGIGGVYIMRWFWWRVNAWSEISAWSASATAYLTLYFTRPDLTFGWRLMIITGFSTLCWLTVTLLTRPVEEQKLIAFFKRVRPESPLWKPIREKVLDVDVPQMGWRDIACWLLGIVFVYSFLFAIGKLVLGFLQGGLILMGVSALSGYLIIRLVSQRRGLFA